MSSKQLPLPSMCSAAKICSEFVAGKAGIGLGKDRSGTAVSELSLTILVGTDETLSWTAARGTQTLPVLSRLAPVHLPPWVCEKSVRAKSANKSVTQLSIAVFWSCRYSDSGPTVVPASYIVFVFIRGHGRYLASLSQLKAWRASVTATEK